MSRQSDSARMQAQRLHREIRETFNTARMREDLSLKEVAQRLGIDEDRLDRILEDPKLLTVEGLARLMTAVRAQVQIQEVEH